MDPNDSKQGTIATRWSYSFSTLVGFKLTHYRSASMCCRYVG